jgi:predicted lipid-binding transport protein (Tim44 family)
MPVRPFKDKRADRALTTTNLLSFVAGALGGIVAGSPGGLIGSSVGGAGGALGPFVQAGLNLHHVPITLSGTTWSSSPSQS